MNNTGALKFLDSFHLCDLRLKHLLTFTISRLPIFLSSPKIFYSQSDRNSYNKCNDIQTWEDLMFHSCAPTRCPKKRIVDEMISFQAEISTEIRKPICLLKTKALRNRLKPLLHLIDSLAEREKVEPKVIATYALQLISNENHDRLVSTICASWIYGEGTFGRMPKKVSIEKSSFLLDLLEIGKRKYSALRHLCKSEDILLR